MDYKFAGNFTQTTDGAFTEAHKKQVWNDPASTFYDADKNGEFFSIVDDDRFPNGKACRMRYPKGGYGMNQQFYQVRIKSPQTIANLEWLWLFENGFEFYDYALDPPNGGGGKCSPCINWGEVGGETSKRGTRCMIWWNAYGSNKSKPCFAPSCQDQRSGNQLIQPVKYSKPIVLDSVYKFRIQMRGGPGGFAKYWITYPGDDTETLLADTGTKDMMATATDDVLNDFAFFSGGGSESAPNHDSYARHGGVRYWSGGEYWLTTDEPGNGGGGSGGGGGGSPTSDLTVTIDGVTYSASGNLTLTRRT